MADHDGNYKALFSRQRVVADFLRGYVAREWIGELDLDCLETVAASHVSEARHQRHNDIIWRLPWRDEQGDSDWLYCYFMLEFQSGQDQLMAVRIMTYIGLFYEHLVKTGQANPRALPPLLPIVLYNGEERWNAATDVAELIPRFPKAFARFIPQVGYLFLDEGRMATSEQMAERNLAAAIFQIEQSEVSDVLPLTNHVMRWLEGADQKALRRDLAIWVETVILGPERLSGLQAAGRLTGVEEPEMLAKKAEIWRESLIAQGEARGRAEGEARGRAEGEARGRAEGEARGQTHAAVAIIRQLVSKGQLSVDHARIQIEELITSGELSEEAGRAALDQLG